MPRDGLFAATIFFVFARTTFGSDIMSGVIFVSVQVTATGAGILFILTVYESMHALSVGWSGSSVTSATGTPRTDAISSAVITLHGGVYFVEGAGVGAGVGVGAGAGVEAGFGAGAGAGVWVGVGAGADAGVWVGAGAGAGVGDGVGADGAGLGAGVD